MLSHHCPSRGNRNSSHPEDGQLKSAPEVTSLLTPLSLDGGEPDNETSNLMREAWHRR